MPNYLAPGVYFERADAGAPTIPPLRTDVAGFVGIAARGPVDTPLPLQSWRQFKAFFGDFTGAGYLAYAVRAFFENGGRRCWVTRVASRLPGREVRAAQRTIPGLSGAPAWRIRASSPGGWGNRLSVSLAETRLAQTVSEAGRSQAEGAFVSSTAGFERGSLVRLTQDGAAERYKLVAGVDSVDGRILWTSSGTDSPLPGESPLAGVDLNRPLFIESVEYRLIVLEFLRPVALYERLSPSPWHSRYGPGVLAELDFSKFRQSPESLASAPGPIVVEAFSVPSGAAPEPLDVYPAGVLTLSDGADGLGALEPSDYIGEEVSPLDGDALRESKRRGLRALETVDEVSIVAVPDIHIQPFQPAAKAPPPECPLDPCLPLEAGDPPAVAPVEEAAGELPPVFTDEQIHQVQAAAVEQCERLRDRVVLLEPPAWAVIDDGPGASAAAAWRNRFETQFAAFYYPWLRVSDPLRSAGSLRDIPPSGHVAGLYARTDLEIGVHKAPANAALIWVQDVTKFVGAALQETLNPLGVNAIRPLPGRGIRVFGARTAGSDPDWRYINVRRLMIMIEEAIEVATQWAVFEPNDSHTRAKLTLSLSGFLTALWQRGALTGNAPEEAFFVKCDEENNPSVDRDMGRLQAEVGVAPSQPFEFIVLRVGRTDNGFEAVEAASSKEVA